MSETIRYGIDVSSYNGDIDWHKVKAAGVEHAVIKVTKKDLSPDQRFKKNWEGCQKAGIPCSVYRYVYESTVKEAENAAKAVVKLLEAQNAPKGTMIWWDVEDQCLRKAADTTLTSSILAAQKAAGSAGYSFGVYCGKYWYESVLRTEDLSCPFLDCPVSLQPEAGLWHTAGRAVSPYHPAASVGLAVQFRRAGARHLSRHRSGCDLRCFVLSGADEKSP